MTDKGARFLQRGDNVEKARAALRRVRETEEEVEEEILRIREALEYEKEAISSNYSALWKDKSLRKRMLLALVINAGQQVTGQGSLNSYSTKIYQKVFPSAGTIALINALNATFGIIFTLNAVWIIDRFGRKFLLIVGGIGMGLCMIIVAAVETETPSPHGVKTESVGISIVFLLFLFIFFYKPSWGATVWIWTSEVFSMNVRAQAVGMASQTQNVANAIFQQFFPIFLKNCGFYAFYMFAGVNFLLAVFVWFFIPETKQVPLEEIDALFGGANHVTNGERMMMGEKERHFENQANEKSDAVTIENLEARR
jgi:MFS family permease